jgi:hypothetical protein
VHPYSIDSNERTTRTIEFGIFAAVLSLILELAVYPRVGVTALPLWVQALLHLSPLGIAVALIRFHDNVSWKSRLWKFRGSSIPNLTGRWTGTINNNSIERHCNLEIRQTWSKISVKFWTDRTESESMMAALWVESRHDLRLGYAFASERKSSAPTIVQATWGAAQFKIDRDQLSMTGDFIAGHPVAKFGGIVLRRDEDSPA